MAVLPASKALVWALGLALLVLGQAHAKRQSVPEVTRKQLAELTASEDYLAVFWRECSSKLQNDPCVIKSPRIINAGVADIIGRLLFFSQGVG